MVRNVQYKQSFGRAKGSSVHSTGSGLDLFLPAADSE